MTTTTDTITTETDNTFYFDKSYRDFNAYTGRLKFETLYPNTFFVVGAVLFLSVSIFAFLANDAALNDFGFLCLFTLSVIIMVHWMVTMRRHRQLVSSGILLDGEVVSGNVRQSAGLIYVYFEFVSPTFERLKGKQILRASFLPFYHDDYISRSIQVGTPIKVLYTNRRNFVAL